MVTPSKIPVWLDCDPGHDDAFAILLAAHHPSIELIGISTVHGNASVDQTSSNALALLTAIGRDDVKVVCGSRHPFCRSAVHAPDIHGATGLDGTQLLPRSNRTVQSNAILAMREAIEKKEFGFAWLVATGALTNIALLFATFPELIDQVEGLSIMGGAIGGGFTDAVIKADERNRCGNHTEWAEFNIYCDPEAAQSIFSNAGLAARTTLIPLDLTHQVVATKKVQNMVLHGCDRKGTTASSELTRNLRPLLHDLLSFFASTHRNVFALADGPPLHDPVAVAAVLPTSEIAFDDGAGERWHVEVVTDGRHSANRSECGQLGRTVVSKVEGSGVRIPRGVDVSRFWELVQTALSAAENTLLAKA